MSAARTARRRVDRRRAAETALPPRADVREDGSAYLTPVVAVAHCEAPNCGLPIQQHAAGRKRRYCDSTCRKRKQRLQPRLW